MKTDLDILYDVIDQIKNNKIISASVIVVAVKDGIVTLTGNVDKVSQKLEAGKVARNVPGLKSIVEDIQVIVPPPNINLDSEIKQSVINAFKSNPTISLGNIKVNVKGGEVTLEGETNWAYERNAACNVASCLPDVKCVHNLITVKPKVKPFEDHLSRNLFFQRSMNLKRGELFTMIGIAILQGLLL